MKCLDGTANPYVAIAAMLMSGILGIEGKTALKVKECQASPVVMTDGQRKSSGITAKMPGSVEEARKALRDDLKFSEAMGKDFIQQCLEFNEVRILRCGVYCS